MPIKIQNFIIVLFAILALTACAAVPSNPNDAVVTSPGQGSPPDEGVQTPTGGEWLRGEVFLQESQVLLLESYPIQVRVLLRGEKPTPCHEMRVVISEPDEQNRIDLEVFTEVELGEMCIQVIEPFEETVAIPMNGAPDGEYTIWVNGELIGEFAYPGG